MAGNAPRPSARFHNLLKLLTSSPPSERSILIIQGAWCRRRQGFSTMVDVDIDKLMRVAELPDI
jgi:hypothetical protein